MAEALDSSRTANALERIKDRTLVKTLTTLKKDGPAFANISAEQKQKLFDRGLQVFRAADCAACHSSPTTGAELAGGMAMVTPMGTLYGTNISPSREHGIGKWSADDLYRAVARGMAPGRKNLYPAMPYASYHDITRADVDALWVWLQAQPDEHMSRVVAQGDTRPMAANPEAMDDLRRILDGRSAFYSKADHVLDTSGKSLAQSFRQLRALVAP